MSKISDQTLESQKIACYNSSHHSQSDCSILVHKTTNNACIHTYARHSSYRGTQRSFIHILLTIKSSTRTRSLGHFLAHFENIRVIPCHKSTTFFLSFDHWFFLIFISFRDSFHPIKIYSFHPIQVSPNSSVSLDNLSHFPLFESHLIPLFRVIFP